MVSVHFMPMRYEDGFSHNKGIQVWTTMWKNWALHTLLVGTDHDSDIVEKQFGKSSKI